MLHTPKAICRYFNSITGCKFGTNCKFSHISNLPEFYSRSHENDEPVKAERAEEILGSISKAPAESTNSNHEAVSQFAKEELVSLPAPKPSPTASKNYEAVNRSTNSKANFSSQKHFQDFNNRDNDEAAVIAKGTDGNLQDKKCYSYSKYGRCRFGSKCRFRHEISDKLSSSDSCVKTDNVARKPKLDSGDSESKNDSGTRKGRYAAKLHDVFEKKPCRYFISGNCRNGNRCKFSHQKENVEKASGKSARVSGTEIVEKADVISTRETKNPQVKVPRKPPFKPRHITREIKRSKATEEEIRDLRKDEIQQMKRRFPSNKLKTLKEDDNESMYLLKFSSSDPDWPYDVKVFEMELTFLPDYPVTCFKVVLPVDQDLPETVRRYVEVSVMEWLDKKKSELEKSDRLENIFRSFIRWLDKHLEDIVTEALKQLKRELFAKAAGYEFIPASQLKARLSEGGHKGEVTDSDTGSEEGVTEEEPVVVYRKKSNEDLEEYTGPEKQQIDLNALDVEDMSSHIEPFPTANLNNERRGTEIKLQNLQLKEDVSTLTFTHIKMVIQCSRCKTSSDVETPGGRVNMLACHKCHNVQYLTFRPAMIHQFSSIVGYLDLEDCTPFDVVLQDSACKLGCFSCGKETKLNGLAPGHMVDSWCRSCSLKMKLATDGTKFTLLLQTGVEKDKGDIHEVATKKNQKIINDPVIKLGSPLPDNGTCKHYKKSYRWFRFPCCGKTYPCDICHDEKEFGHEMIRANRMICGFCCKEQPYAVEKPCVACDHSLTRASTTHWEGGKGCRDKIKMSRDDSQKYSSLNKTVSRKATEKKSNKKTTKLRHSSK